MSEVVLDASAILALLNKEAGSEEVLKFIGKAAISTVNLSEVMPTYLIIFGVFKLVNVKKTGEFFQGVSHNCE